jgi:hypothetical protein
MTNRIVFDLSTGVETIVLYTAEEEAEHQAIVSEYAANSTLRESAKIRAIRNDKLKESDWTQIADSTVDKTAWATYRQSLRDVPTQSGFPNEVVWPVAP